MSNEKQSSDSAQGGEGTRSLHNKSWSPETKNIGTPPGNTQAVTPDSKVGAK